MILVGLSPLANHLWQSTLCASAVWLLTLALKKNGAAVRYWLWLGASAKFLIPFSVLVSIGRRLGWRTIPAIAHPHWILVVGGVGRPFPAADPSLTLHTVTPAPSHAIPAILLGLWLCGFAASIAIWAWHWRQMRAAERGAMPLPLGLLIPVMSVQSLREPGVFGIFRPVLLLPEGIGERLTRTTGSDPRTRNVPRPAVRQFDRRNSHAGGSGLLVLSVVVVDSDPPRGGTRTRLR